MQRILIVEDIGDTRRWLAGVACAAFGECEIDEAANVSMGIRLATDEQYDLAFIDLGLPDGSGLQVLETLHQQHPETLCIVTTVMGDDASIVGALVAGANGYLLKEHPEDVLVRQLTMMAEGIPPLSPSVARRIMGHFRLTGPTDSTTDTTLTEREREVLFLIGRGLSNREAAEILKLSGHTIGSYIKDIYRKLGICSRAEAAWHAVRLGLGSERD
ncbi:DNA-binding response regulator [Aliidiomarina taiwanensis]|uniref:DNA-binding response regulator n=1 Tax=Aliidiomarina taiwanensis TaxID=946228 RepID=A0A432X8I9_9GAMM|nr:response regulator transcription factor [Aliidiomarina taiwanensis]RUO43735.1 DNA-binding response regulator [Aliidiomarina taiwanensis]